MDIHNSSKEPGGYLKKVKRNDRVQALRGMLPPCSWRDRTLSKKDRGVKIFSRNPLNGVGGSKLPPWHDQLLSKLDTRAKLFE
jgi:hypothetical protein